jgi:hypothetical protein
MNGERTPLRTGFGAVVLVRNIHRRCFVTQQATCLSSSKLVHSSDPEIWPDSPGWIAIVPHTSISTVT